MRPSRVNGAASGDPRPSFLGFTHYCGRTRVKHKTEGKRLTRKLTALRQEAWRLMHESLAARHEWFAALLRRHYGYYGRPHNYPARSTASIAKCVGLGSASETAQSEKSAPGLVGVRDPDGTLPSARSTHHSHLIAGADMTRVTSGKSRVRESRPPGSVRAKAKWLSYSTIPQSLARREWTRVSPKPVKQPAVVG